MQRGFRFPYHRPLQHGVRFRMCLRVIPPPQRVSRVWQTDAVRPKTWMTSKSPAMYGSTLGHPQTCWFSGHSAYPFLGDNQFDPYPFRHKVFGTSLWATSTWNRTSPGSHIRVTRVPLPKIGWGGEANDGFGHGGSLFRQLRVSKSGLQQSWWHSVYHIASEKMGASASMVPCFFWHKNWCRAVCFFNSEPGRCLKSTEKILHIMKNNKTDWRKS